MATKITIHMDVVNQILNVADVPRMVRRTGNSVLSSVISETPVGETAAMKASNRHVNHVQAFRNVTSRIFNVDPAAGWVNRGTGEYNRDGPTGRIFPRTAPLLVFPARKYPSPDGMVRVASIAGQEANEFMWRGLVKGVARSGYIWSVRKNVP
jgi:hypothetical protein